LQIATTHLDNAPPFAIQRAQAAEAIGSLNVPIGSLTNPALPIVFMGDLNVDPRDDSRNPTFPTLPVAHQHQRRWLLRCLEAGESRERWFHLLSSP
jgi:hypothetical protein